MNFKAKNLYLQVKIEEIIKEFNKYRVPEIEAHLKLLKESFFEITFLGSFCETCGFYDCFEDFQILSKEFGLVTNITEIKEIMNGANVLYTIKRI